MESENMARKISHYFWVIFFIVAWVEVPITKLQQVQHELIWTKQGLKWTDFQHVDIIPGSSNAIGKTTTKLYYTVTDTIVTNQSNKLQLIKVHSVMLPHKSYIKNNAPKKGLLEHEQIHFDIAEVESRKFRKALSEKIFDEKKVEDQVKRLYRKHLSNIGIMNNQYDAHHLNVFIGHEQWRKNLNRDLGQLEKYTSVEVWIQLKIN
jgi:hypothetical protein